MNPFAHFEDQFGHLQLSDNDAALHVFLAGWNSAMMEMMQRGNKMPFGDDTRASFAVYFQSQMVNVDAIEKPAQQDSTCNKTLLAQGKAYPRTCKKCDLGPCIGEPVKPAQQLIHCKHKRENGGVCPHHNLHCGWPKCNEPEQPAQQCRTDGRCQYAIDSGAEVMGHCPKGKCVMPAHQETVAVVSGYYGGQCVILPIDPARIFNSNTPLYTSPQPCPTCEALARTVMLEQTSHDTHRKPLPCETLIELWCDASLANSGSGWFVVSQAFARAIEAAHGIGEKNG